MRLITGRNHAHFNLDGGMSQGPKYIVRPARDPIAQEPEDGQIKALLQRCLCRAKLGEGCWEVTGVSGRMVRFSFDATFDEWTKLCEQLLKEAMDQDVGP